MIEYFLTCEALVQQILFKYFHSKSKEMASFHADNDVATGDSLRNSKILRLAVCYRFF